MSGPLVVRRSANPWTGFGIELFDHLRLDYVAVPPSAFLAQLPDRGIAVLLEPGEPTAAELQRLAAWVVGGGALVCCSGGRGLRELAGAADAEPVTEGRIRVMETDSWCARFDVAMRGFGGVALDVRDDAVEVLARWQDGAPAVTRRAVGSGQVVIVGPDVWQSIGRIKQGWPVDGPGRPAPDLSAPVGADGILRCDDGLALSYADRAMPDGGAPHGEYPVTYPPDGPSPLFHRPVADLWCELVLNLLLDAAERVRVPLAWLHYWPAGVSAVGHMSHDSDVNDDDQACLGLQVFADAGVRVSWCHCWPGGYREQTVAAIAAAGHEQALHYNALADGDGMPWGPAELTKQHAWARAITGRPVVTNKNHYTRWEGWTEFYDWCADTGIQVEQSHGPSKPGTVGFPYGTCHVSFPVGPDGRRHSVLTLPFHTQDVGWQSDESVIDLILDQAREHHGVAHFLFHSANMVKSQRVVAAVGAAAEAGRASGMPWWTADEINRFERTRRGVEVQADRGPAGVVRVRVKARQPVPGAGLDIAGLGGGSWHAEARGVGQVPAAAVQRHGRTALEVTLDLPAGTTDVVLTPQPSG